METLARAVVRARYLVLLVWAAVAVLAVPTALRVGEVLSVEGQWVEPVESARASDLIRETFPSPVSKLLAVTVRGPVPVDSQPFRALLEALAEAAAAEPYVDDVVSYLTSDDEMFLSPDRRSTFLIATVGPQHADTVTRAVPAFRSAMQRAAATSPDGSEFEVRVTGEPAFEWDITTVAIQDARRGEVRALIPTAAVLLLAFGALVAAALPIVIGVGAIVLALAAVYVVGAFFSIAVFVVPVISMVGLGVGIDYSLFITGRFREELHGGRSPEEAAVRAVTTAGQCVVTSGLTVAIGFGALLLTPASETRSVGIGGLLVVAAAVLLAVTLLPAMLVLLGRRIDWPAWLSSRLTWYHTWGGWQRWGGWVARHRWLAAAGGLLVLAAVTWPLTRIDVRMPPAGWFPAGTESSEGAEVLETMGARGSLMPVRVVVTAPEGERIVGTRYLRGLMRLSKALGADPRVARVLGPVDLEPGVSTLEYAMMYGNLETARERYPELMEAYVSNDGRTALTDLFLVDTASVATGMDVVRDVRALVAEGVSGLDGVSVMVGGFAAAGADEEAALKGAFPRMVALILLVTAVMLAIAFRSVLVPLKAVVMNLLSVAGAFGLIVLVFQWGHGASVFGLDAGTEAIHIVVPVLAFAIVFGLSMDYEVFLLSRIREAFDRSGDNEAATTEGLGATASFITSAAAIMVIVFGAFAFSRVQVAQMLGFALATAVLLDATIIRLVLVPAFMHIAGRWNWWPGVRRGQGRDGP